MEKKMVLIVKDWHEGRGDVVYVVDEPGFAQLAESLVGHAHPDDLPKLELAMWTAEQIAEAERIGEEMA